MRKKIVSSMLGSNNVREEIELLGGTFYIKLLSVYDAILCEISCRKLRDKLIKQGADKRLTESITENACLATMCLCDEKDKAVFSDSFATITTLTPEELLKVARKYEKLQKEFLTLDNINNTQIEVLKKN